MHPFLRLIVAAEADLSRCDYLSLPQQALMEIVVEGHPEKVVFQDNKGNFFDFREWIGVGVDPSGSVQSVSWNDEDTPFTRSGSISLRFFPPTTRKIDLSGNNLADKLELADLPRDLESLSIERNELTGSLDFTHAPKGLRIFEVSDNQLSGTLQFAGACGGLTNIRVSGNHFTGTLNTRLLPQGLENFETDENSLHGDLDTSGFPASLMAFLARHNKLSGTLDLTCLPEKLEELALAGNQFTGSIDLTRLPRELASLILFSNQLTGTIDWTRLPKAMTELMLNDNAFSGKLDFASMRVGSLWGMLAIAKNKFTGTLDVGFMPVSVSSENEYTDVQYTYDASENDLTGSLDLSHCMEPLHAILMNDNRFITLLGMENLPNGLLRLDLRRNRFSGTFLFAKLPETLEELDVQSNHFGGTVSAFYLPNLARFNVSDNGFTGCFRKELFLEQCKTVLISRNMLTGPLDLSWNEQSLKTQVQMIDLGRNTFESTVQLDALPLSLESLNLKESRLHGTLNLCYLPENTPELAGKCV